MTPRLLMLCAGLFLCACPSVKDPGDTALVVDSDADDDGYLSGVDCDDTDAAIHPGAEDAWYDGVDADCGQDSDFDADLDGHDSDGYGGDDCDDSDPDIAPGADEYCDGIDSDCDGVVDPSTALDGDYWYEDADEDGYGNPDAFLTDCARPEGTVSNYDDCDDGEPTVHPGADEIACDGLDNDCDPQTAPPPTAMTEGVSYATVQEAIDAAPEGGTVDLCEGSFAENLLIAKNLTLRGLFGSDLTEVDAPDGGPALIIEGEVVRIEEITFRHGTGTENSIDQTIGGTVRISADDSLADRAVSFDGCVITGGEATLGGCVYVGSHAVIDISDTRIEDCAAEDGGGMWLGDEVVATFSGVTISDNEAEDGGGGVTTQENVEVVADSATTISDNTASVGGGLDLGNYSTWEGGVIASNEATLSGGGVCLWGSFMRGTIIEYNEAQNQGGGLITYVDPAGLEDMVISHNEASMGGGIALGGYLGITGGEVTDNVASIWGGGAYPTVGTLVSDSVDWGSGGTDNDPDDVYTMGGSYSYGSNASFVCTMHGCN